MSAYKTVINILLAVTLVTAAGVLPDTAWAQHEASRRGDRHPHAERSGHEGRVRGDSRNDGKAQEQSPLRHGAHPRHSRSAVQAAGEAAPGGAGGGRLTGTVIAGVVTDAETGEPLPAVNVIVKHTTVGVATDRNGRYRIDNAPVGSIQLVATMVGYRRQQRQLTLEDGERATADFALETTILELGAVVITGTSTPHIVEDMPVRTEVIPRKLIEQKHACNLAEALSFHTGVRVENNCQNCNFTQVRILGLDGKYTQILIDGDPVVSSLAGVYGLEHLPEEMVDQIEIVKGGGSSLYGGGAVAGVINVITRRPMTNQVRLQYRNSRIGTATDQNIGAVAETVFKKGTSGAYVFGSFRTRDPYDHNGDGFTELGRLRSEALGFKWYYNPFENSEVLATLHHIHEDRRGGNLLDRPVHEADVAEWVEHWRTGGTLRWSHRPTSTLDYRLFYSFSSMRRESYYGGRDGDTPEERLDALSYYGYTRNPMHIGGAQVNVSLRNHLLTAGAQHSSDHLEDRTAASSRYYLDHTYANTGVFLQDNLHFGDHKQLEFVAGVRADRHSEVEEWIFSPRLNAKYELIEDIVIRAAFTTGFKPPQTYDEDLHLEALANRQRIHRNAAGLKEERSWSVTAGTEYVGYLGEMATMLSLTGFVTQLTDAFSERFVGARGDALIWERINSDGARVQGVEADIGLRPTADLDIRAGVTWKRSRYDAPLEDFDTRVFLRTPDLTANLRLSWYTADDLNLYLLGMFYGSAKIPHEIVREGEDEPLLLLETSDSFVQLDAGVTYKLPLNNGLNMKLSAGVKNLLDAYQDDLDTGPNRDPAYVYGPSIPRTFHFGIETMF